MERTAAERDAWIIEHTEELAPEMETTEMDAEYAGFTSITDLELWAHENNLFGETDIHGHLVDRWYLLDWKNNVAQCRYEEITVEMLAGLWHQITGLR